MKVSYTLGIIVLVMMGLATSPTNAQTWDQQLLDSTRFKVLLKWGGAGVLDRDTGLVWEKSPSLIQGSITNFNWLDAQSHCNTLTVGNRERWRLPTVQELVSLVDYSVANPGPVLPSGHPFIGVQQDLYWSADTFASNPAGIAWVVDFIYGNVTTRVQSLSYFVWCVYDGER